jgi:hypothetical protein
MNQQMKDPHENSELDEIDERLGDPYSMTQREYDSCARMALLSLILGLLLVGLLYGIWIAAT